MEEKPATTETSTAPTTKPAADPNLLVFPKSQNVASAKLDPDAGTVDVTFANQSVHRFAKFTAAQLAEWKEAKSAGSWFHQHVKLKPEDHPHLGSLEKGVLVPPREAPAPVLAAQSTPAAIVAAAEKKVAPPKPAAPPPPEPEPADGKPRPGTRAFVAGLLAKRSGPNRTTT